MNDYVDKLWNSDAVACLDALKEADEAVETINKDMFSIIADVANDIVQENGKHSDVALKDTLKKFEYKYKGERSLKHMPGSYRSAKSTIVNAVKHGINLFDPIDGKLKGKSALEKEINQIKKQRRERRVEQDGPAPDFVEEYLDRVFKDMKKAVDAECFHDKANVASYIDRIRDQLDRLDEKIDEV